MGVGRCDGGHRHRALHGEGVLLLPLGLDEHAAATLREVAEVAIRLSRSWMRNQAENVLALVALRIGRVDLGYAGQPSLQVRPRR